MLGYGLALEVLFLLGAHDSLLGIDLLVLRIISRWSCRQHYIISLSEVKFPDLAGYRSLSLLVT